MEKENYIKEVKAGLILLVCFSICIGFIYFLKINFESHHFYYIVGYIVIVLIFAMLSKSIKNKNKVLNHISEIVIFPISIFYGLLTIFISFLRPLISFTIYLAICIMLPNAFFMVIEKFNLVWLANEDTIFFIKMTTGVLIAVLFNFQIRNATLWLVIRMSKESVSRNSSTNKSINYILSAKNIRFLIYSSYVILLFAINYLSFESSWLSEGTSKDKAILQSFVTFIALDRALTLLKDLEFKPSDFLKIIVSSVLMEWQKTEKEVEEFKARRDAIDEENEKDDHI